MSSRKRTYNLSDLFQIVVETVPDKEALVCGERRLTYRQIEDRATKLALWLLSKGIAGKSGRRKLRLVDWDGDKRLDILINSTNCDWMKNLRDEISCRRKIVSEVRDIEALPAQ